MSKLPEIHERWNLIRGLLDNGLISQEDAQELLAYPDAETMENLRKKKLLLELLKDED